MYDLLEEKERRQLVLFAESFFSAIQNNIPTPKNFQPVVRGDLDYLPGTVEGKADLCGKKVLILTDTGESRTNLGLMIDRFSRAFSNPVEVINLNDLDIKGGCLGCIQCGYDNRCVYEGRDGYVDFYNGKVKTADILVFAGAIKDRYLSSIWKRYFDRSFFTGHAPSLIGTQIGFIISGPLRQISNLRQILEAEVQLQHANCVGFCNRTNMEIQRQLTGCSRILPNVWFRRPITGIVVLLLFLVSAGQKFSEMPSGEGFAFHSGLITGPIRNWGFLISPGKIINPESGTRQCCSSQRSRPSEEKSTRE